MKLNLATVQVCMIDSSSISKMKTILFSLLTTFPITVTLIENNSAIPQHLTPNELIELQTKLSEVRAELQEERSHNLFLRFVCAMQHFKYTNEYIFQNFRLYLMKSITEADPWPKNMYEFIQNSDYYMKDNNKCPSKIMEADLGYTKWHKLVTCKSDEEYNPPLLNYKYLQRNLSEYYKKYSSTQKFKTAPMKIDTLDTFHQYFAVTMQRSYKLGCMSMRGLLFEMNKPQYQTQHFPKVFYELLPGWSLTQFEVDLLNIAWSTPFPSGKLDDELLTVGFTFHNGIVIPTSTHCMKTYTTLE